MILAIPEPASHRMTKRYVVVDQNVLRKPYLETLMVDDPDLHIVLPDMAFLEMTKTGEWESTLRNSLATLSQYPRRVHACLSVNEALSSEMDAMRPINSRMMFPEASKFIRDLLCGFQSGLPSQALERIRENPDGHLDKLIHQHLNHEENKERWTDLIEVTGTMLSPEATKRLRAKTMDAEERLRIIHDIGVALLPDILATRNIDRAVSVAFMKKRPMTLRYLYLKTWRCLRWLGDGGFDSRTPEAVTNEQLDDQYILAATFFNGLLSEERSVNEAYRDLRLLITIKV